MIQNHQILITCEHAVNTVPEEYAPLFLPFRNLLESHRGIDFGALEIAQHLQKMTHADLEIVTATRLLIDCNRSLHHARCFSEVTKNLTHQEKQKIIEEYYAPFRQQVMSRVSELTRNGHKVLHLSIHSFTPVMNDEVRNADIGLLYDPRRILEKNWAAMWQEKIKKIAPEFRVRKNYPYKGINDGFNSALRKQFAPDIYIGLEVESNQKLVENTQSLNKLKNIIAESLLSIDP